MLGCPPQGEALGYHLWPFQGHVPARVIDDLTVITQSSSVALRIVSGEGLA